MQVITFDEALRFSNDARRRHLVLGNGFSIARFRDIFSYSSLLNEADFAGKPHLRKIFETLGSQDFEAAIKSIQQTATLLEQYNADRTLVDTLKNDAINLKEILIRTIARRHPEAPSNIEPDEFDKCGRFLSHFLNGTKPQDAGHVYTLNYDLLLYWTIMQCTNGGTKRTIDINDGFSKPDYDTDRYVVYNGFKTGFYQRIFYLHGALHLFDDDGEVQKLVWNNTNARIIEQTRDGLNEDLFPIYVAEGESNQKINKIRHNPYLNSCYEQFKKDMLIGPIENDAIFIFGHSLDQNDDHVLKYIFSGKIEHIYISIFGDPESAENAQMLANYKRLKQLYAPVRVPNIRFFDAGSARVWG